MKLILIKIFFISTINFSVISDGISQISGFIKTGINFGFINKDSWDRPGSGYAGIEYGKPLIRPIFGYGIEHTYKKINFNFTLLYQTKGQGTSVPKVRNLFQSTGPDVIHFMSFPIGLKYKVWPKFSIGAAIQPSLFLGGSDNYYANPYWKGWIWGSVLSIHYFIQEEFEIGFDYDYDFTYYYCDGCDDKFYTYRVFGAYHFKSK